MTDRFWFHVFAWLRGVLWLRRCERAGRVLASGYVRVVGEGRIALGAGVMFVGGVVATEITTRPGAVLTIGGHSVVNYGASIECVHEVRLGERCMVASYVRIADDGPAGTASVVVGDDVWIAHGAVILPGVHIGDGAVVSAGSVVTGDVPPHTLAIGNPARNMPIAFLRTKEPAHA